MSNFISKLEKQYFEELKEFYSPYFPTLEEVYVFINKAIQLDWDDRKPRQMLCACTFLPLLRQFEHQAIL